MNYSKTTYYAILVSLGGFLFGFDASVISGVVRLVTVEWNLSAVQQGILVSAPTLGGIISALMCAPLADQYGRKPILILLGLIYLASAVLSAFAPDFDTLVAARALGGMAFGSLGLAPIYIAEISPAHKRGFMVSFNQMNIVVGFAVSYFSNFLLISMSQSGADWVSAYQIDTQTWRWMLGIELIPVSIFLIGVLLIPESPRWLTRVGKEDRARDVLKSLFPGEDINALIKEIKASFEEACVSVVKQIPELLSPKLRFVLLIGLIVGIAQQISGINAVYFYAPTIFEQTGVGTNAAFAQAALLGVTNVVCTIIAMSFIDRLGRKPLLLIGLAGIIISMSLASYGFGQATYKLESAHVESLELSADQEAALAHTLGKLYDSEVSYKNDLRSALGDDYASKEGEILKLSSSMNATLILIAIIGFTASFAISLGPVMWCLFSEIFPNRARGICNSVVGLFNAGASWLVQFSFPLELQYLGTSTTFLIYALLSVLSFVLIAWLLPESKGKSLEELEEVMRTK